MDTDAESQGSARGWVFTLNNYTQEDWGEIVFLTSNDCELVDRGGYTFKAMFAWFTVAQEVAPTTGTPHLQGAFHTKMKISRKRASLLIPFLSRAYLCKQRSKTDFHPWQYCQKSGVVVNWGDLPKPPGEKKPPRPSQDETLRDCFAMLDASPPKTLKEIFQIHPSVACRNVTALKEYANHAKSTRDCTTMPTMIVYYGPTGSGKSYRAHALAREAGEYYVKAPSNKWWCFYRGEKTVVLEEFKGGFLLSDVFRWIDAYPCLIENKGGGTQLQADKFYCTSHFHPREWYSDEDRFPELARRITKLYYCAAWDKEPVDETDLLRAEAARVVANRHTGVSDAFFLPVAVARGGAGRT